MSIFLCRKHLLFCRKALSAVLVLCFGVFTVVGPVESQTISLPSFGLTTGLAADGLGIPSDVAQRSSVTFQPPVLRGMTVHPENPLLFDFIVDRGQEKIGNDLLKDESTKLIKYFLTSMTIPDKDAWVNLSPYEKDRIIPDALGQTEMGRQMLEQDYVLKQLAASLTNPDTELGKRYWEEVNKRSTDVGNRHACSLQNKVWIVPDGATVVEKDGFAYITESKLNVMLDVDYGSQNLSSPHALSGDPLHKIDSRFRGNDIEKLSTAVFRQLILPKLIEEVNTGKNFAATRQVYQSVILAAWYKRTLKDSLLGKIYVDKSKIDGVETDVKDIKQKVYEQYLEAFKKGAYNVIKEEDGPDGELIPRKYFSGGALMSASSALIIKRNSVAVSRALQEIWGYGKRILLFGVNIIETKLGAQYWQSKAAADLSIKINPIKIANSLEGALFDILGVDIEDFTMADEDDDDGPTFKYKISHAPGSQERFWKSIRTLKNGQKQEVVSNIVGATYQRLGSSVERSQNQQLNQAVESVVEIFNNITSRTEGKLSNGKVVEFYTTSHYDSSTRFQNIKLIIEEILKKEHSFEDARENQEQNIIVEQILEASNRYDVFLVIVGEKKYVIKKALLKEGRDTLLIRNQIEILEVLKGNPYIVRQIVSGQQDGVYYSVMEYLPEPTLSDKIASDGPLTTEQTVDLALGVVRALTEAHRRGILIRDLVPRNIKINGILFDFDTSAFKNYDWGNDPLGFRGIRYIYDFEDSGNSFETMIWDEQEDIANVGQVIYYAATGKNLRNVSEINIKTIPDQRLRGIISRCVGPRESARYNSAEELLAELIILKKSLPNTTTKNLLSLRSRRQVITQQGFVKLFDSIDPDVDPNAQMVIETPDFAASSPSVSGQAQVASTPTAVGGIDFDPSKLDLQIKRDGRGVPLPLPQQDFENIDIKGLYPVIMNIAPVNAQTLPILGQLQVSPDAAVLPQS